ASRGEAGMTFLFYLLLIVVLLGLILGLPILLLLRVVRLRRELDDLTRRFDALEHARPAAPPAPALVPTSETPPPRPVPAAPPPRRAQGARRRVRGSPPPPPAPAARRDDAEQWVGAVGLQNVGSVLLLVGFFFLVLWGYTTGRFGPLVLVAAGVIAGFGVVW